MLSYEEVQKYYENYKIENGIVMEKSSNKEITDEDIILRVKSSKLIVRDALELYKSDSAQFGNTGKSQADYIRKMMERYSLNGEVKDYGINKVINGILASNGHYEERVPTNDLREGKFSMFTPPKQDYGIAYLKQKFREKGLDIDDFKIALDTSEFKQIGSSKVIIDFKIKKYDKVVSSVKEESIQNSNRYVHPMADRLNELENDKQNAKANNDMEAYKKAQVEIEKIIYDNPATVSPEEWDSMNKDKRTSFVEIKINESKVLHDKDAYDYWNTVLGDLKNKKEEEISIPTQTEEGLVDNPDMESPEAWNDMSRDERISFVQRKMNEARVERDGDAYDYWNTVLGDLKNKKEEDISIPTQSEESLVDDKNIKSHYTEKIGKEDYYQQLMTAINRRRASRNLTEEERKQIVGEIYNNAGILVRNLKTEQDGVNLFFKLSMDFNDKDAFEKNILDNIMNDIMSKFSKEAKVSEEKFEQDDEIQGERTNIENDLNELKSKWAKIINEYQDMLSDGYIDTDESEILMRRMSELSGDADRLYRDATTQKERAIINSLLDTIDVEKKKIKKSINMAEEVARKAGFGL